MEDRLRQQASGRPDEVSGNPRGRDRAPDALSNLELGYRTSDIEHRMNQPDVIVIGGGPAGSTVSTLLAQQGLKVQLFERERFPRFHIGESLIPETYWVLKRLGMLPKMQQSRFVKKHSVQFVNADGKLSAPFYFWDNKPH